MLNVSRYNRASSLIALILGKKQYAAALVVMKLEKPVIFIGDAPFP
jgi:hypothetical protein